MSWVVPGSAKGVPAETTTAVDAPPVPAIPADADAVAPVVGSRRPRPVISRPSSGRPISGMFKAGERGSHVLPDTPTGEGDAPLLRRTSRQSSTASGDGTDAAGVVGGPRRRSAVGRLRERMSSAAEVDFSGLQSGGPNQMMYHM